MDGTYTTPVQHSMNDGTSSFNQLGRAWRLFNGAQSDISTAGRGFSALQPGQLLSVVIDNPTERQFFRGYTVRLNSGGGNTCYGGAGCTPGTSPVTRLAVGTFEYFTNGRWYASSSDSDSTTSLFDTDTDAGVQIDVTLTGANDYVLVMWPLDDPGNAYAEASTLQGSGPIDWIEFEFYNTTSNSVLATDFYIRSLEIRNVPEPGGGEAWAVAAVLFLGRRRVIARATRSYD
jgi:hypothetical protein